MCLIVLCHDKCSDRPSAKVLRSKFLVWAFEWSARALGKTKEEKEMARFWVGGGENGGGPSTSTSTQAHKRLRTTDPPQPIISLETTIETEEEEEEEDDDDDESTTDEEEEEEEENQNQQRAAVVVPRSSNVVVPVLDQVGPSRAGPISVTLTDPDVLDCCICYEPLSAPVFQCENGHIACSSCCKKLLNKCPSCTLPIGYNRCRAIEKVLESVKVLCQNTKYGCKETISYSKKYDHEKTCIFAPCSCPLSNCDFVSSPEQLYLHFSGKHKNSVISFLYNRMFPVVLNTDVKFLVLQEEKDGILFILNNNNSEHLGNVVTVSCIAPSATKGGFHYDLTAKTQGCSLRFRSLTKSIKARVNDPPSLGFLLVPSYFFAPNGQLKFEVCIWSKGVFAASLPRINGV